MFTKMDGTCNKYVLYINQIILSYLLFKVKIEMVSSERVVAFATLNGRGSDKMSWTSKDRLIESCWKELFS